MPKDTNIVGYDSSVGHTDDNDISFKIRNTSDPQHGI